ncbi:MAG: HAD family hydrolase [Syntrophales bacterium]|jgi:D,D-heptose 1,7-bisphosphate phosphatase
MKKKYAAVFLDRDGTINEEVGYLNSLDKLMIYPRSYDAIRMINASGMKAVVITNQSGVARGYFGEDLVRTVNKRIQQEMNQRGARIDAFYYCPHHPEGLGIYRQTCACRKPATGMLIQASQELDIDLAESFIVGDMLKDIEAGKRAGTRGILVRTGYGKDIQTDEADYIAVDLLDAVKWILKK